MQFYWLVLGGLATWRFTHLLYGEDAPWDLVLRVRPSRASRYGAWLLGQTAGLFSLSELVARRAVTLFDRRNLVGTHGVVARALGLRHVAGTDDGR